METAAQLKNTTIPAIGALIAGGYFAGIVLVDGQRYGVAVAPKEHGETTGSWGEAGKKIDARRVGDGLTNTKAMAAEADSQIAKWALDLDISGYQDWYVPSRDELELIYRNLKPTTEENYASFRDGENPSSVPMGGLYEEGNPLQTDVIAFQDGGEQAMDDAWYWSSTQYSGNTAFIQDFSDGGQNYDPKHYQDRVRAVRRFLID